MSRSSSRGSSGPRVTRLGALASVLLIASGLALGSEALAEPVLASQSGLAPHSDRAACAASKSTLRFAGRAWRVKSSRIRVGPGPNFFAWSNACVSTRGLHLRISADPGGRWQSAEVYLPASLGYGTYRWTVDARLDRLNAQAVLGLFVYESDSSELDIEFSRWGWPQDSTNAQFVIQPWDRAGNLRRFTLPRLRTSIHEFTWTPGTVRFASRSLDGSWSQEWTSTSEDVPEPGGERVHMNLWLYRGEPLAGDARGAEVVISDFAFTPAAP